MYKSSTWANRILSLQDHQGAWGYFHTLSADSPSPYTTEAALKRLEILGYTIADECIQRAVSYMNDCLTGTRKIPDRPGKSDDWNIFTSLMLASRIRRFTGDNPAANQIAKTWADIITGSFAGEEYDHQKYVKSFTEVFGMKPTGGRLVDFSQLYIVSAVNGYLDETTERKFLTYLINKPNGIYYIYEACIRKLPCNFKSKCASRYLGCIELLADYASAKYQLQFVVEWLENSRCENGNWDMGGRAKDGLYFPLSNDWRKSTAREFDCTNRISRLIEKLTL